MADNNGNDAGGPLQHDNATPFLETVKMLFTDPKYSDLAIKCEGRTWNVHKAIVCSRSPVLAKHLDSGMKESQEGVIDLKEEDPRVVEAMLRYLYVIRSTSRPHFVAITHLPSILTSVYQFDYADAGNEQDAVPPILFDVYVHTIAEKYDVPDLIKLAATKFATRAESEWEEPAFADAIEEVYTKAADPKNELRYTVLEICSKRAEALFSHDYGLRFQDVSVAVPAFGGELSRRLAKPHYQPVKDGRTYKGASGGCERTFAMETVKPHFTYSCPYCRWSGNNSSWAKREVRDDQDAGRYDPEWM